MKIKKHLRLALSAPIIVLCFGITASAQTYYGQGTAAKVTIKAPLVSPVSTAVADTGPLPQAGGNISLSSASTSVSGVLSVGSSNVSTSGSAGASHATASINSVNISILGNSITADVVSATTDRSCPLATCSGSSTITNLSINGSTIIVDGSINQTISLPGGVGNVVLNEEILEPRTTTVNAIHIFVTALDTTTTDIIVASARSGVDCGVSPSSNIFGGYGQSVRLTQSLGLPPAYLTSFVADTGWLPRAGGVINTSTAGAGVASLVTTNAAASSTAGGTLAGTPNSTASSSEVDQLGIDLLSGTVTIGATVIRSDTQCSCSLGVPNCSGSSTLTGLSVKVFGVKVPVTITGSPNQIVTIPVGVLGSITLTINEQVSSGNNNFTVNALRVDTNLVGLVATSITISGSHSDLSCAIAVTAAPVSISGRVLDSTGRGLSRATVAAIGVDGLVHSTVTSPFGYFRISGLTAGSNYVMNVQDRRFVFSSRLINAVDDMSDIDFVPVSNSSSKVSNSGSLSVTAVPAVTKQAIVITTSGKKSR